MVHPARSLLVCSMAAIKRQVYEAAESDLRPSFDRASSLMAKSFANSDFKEGVNSYTQKRTPTFNGVGANAGGYFRDEFGNAKHPASKL